jgi:hypothetical protein
MVYTVVMRSLLLFAKSQDCDQLGVLARLLRPVPSRAAARRRHARGMTVMAKLNPIELQKAMKGASYPASKDDLLKTAESNGASGDITSALHDLGDDHFNTPADVTAAVSFASKGSS